MLLEIEPHYTQSNQNLIPNHALKTHSKIKINSIESEWIQTHHQTKPLRRCLGRMKNRYVEVYAKDQKKFFADFAAAFQKLEELGTSNLSDV